MSEKYGNQSTFNRLRKSRRAKVAVAAAALTLLAGCASAKATGGGSSAGKGKAPATASKTPGTRPSTATTAPSTGQSAPTTGQASRANWCKSTATIIEEAFVDPNAPQECEVMPASSTPGDVLIRYTLNTAGATDYSVDLSVINSPFKLFTSAAKPTSGSGTEYVQIPNSTIMYVEVPGDPNVTGELELLSGEGGTDPLGYQNMIPQAAGAFAVFGSTPIKELYPAGAP